MWGTQAKELLESLKKSNWIPEFDAKRVRESQKQVTELQQNVALTIDTVGREGLQNAYYSAGVLVHHSGAEHITRCLNAYVLHRKDELETMWWERGTLLEQVNRDKCCELELEYLDKYDELMNEYMRESGLELTTEIRPPKSLCIEIDVLEHVGEVVTASGFIQLSRGMRQLVKHEEVETLLRQGRVKHVSHAF